MLKQSISIVITALALSLSASAHASVSEFPTSVRQYGCALFDDHFGERELRDVYFYPTLGGVVYYDTHFKRWIGPYGTWDDRKGNFQGGFTSEYHNYYKRTYRPYSLQHHHAGHTCR